MNEKKLLFPEKLILRFSSKITKKPISNLLCKLTFFANTKNNYDFQPFLTDDKGETVVTKEAVKKEIAKIKKLWIMDYESNLEDCSSQIMVEIPSGEEIEKNIANYLSDEGYRKIYKMQYGTELNIEELQRNRNKFIKPIRTYIDLKQDSCSEEKIINIILEENRD